VEDTINVTIKFQQSFAVREHYVNHRFGIAALVVGFLVLTSARSRPRGVGDASIVLNAPGNHDRLGVILDGEL
jgi:hypothetical protein